MFKKIGLDLYNNHIHLVEYDEFSVNDKFKRNRRYNLNYTITDIKYFIEIKDILKKYMKDNNLKSVKLNILLPHDIKDVHFLFEDIPEQKDRNIKKAINTKLKNIYEKNTDFTYKYDKVFKDTIEDNIKIFDLLTISSGKNILKNLAELKNINISIEDVYFKPIALSTIVDDNTLILDSTNKDLSLFLYDNITIKNIKKEKDLLNNLYKNIADYINRNLINLKEDGSISDDTNFNLDTNNTEEEINNLLEDKKIKSKSNKQLSLFDLQLLIAMLFKDQIYKKIHEESIIDLEGDNYIDNIDEISDNKEVLESNDNEVDVNLLSFEDKVKYYHNKKKQKQEEEQEQEQEQEQEDLKEENTKEEDNNSLIKEPKVNLNKEFLDDGNTNNDNDNDNDLSNIDDEYKNKCLDFILKQFGIDLNYKNLNVILKIQDYLLINHNEEIKNLLDNEINNISKILQRQIRGLEISDDINLDRIYYISDIENYTIMNLITSSISENMVDLNIKPLFSMNQFIYEDIEENKIGSFYSELSFNDFEDIKSYNFKNNVRKRVDFISLSLVILLSSITFLLFLNFNNKKVDKKIQELEIIENQQRNVISKIDNEKEKYDSTINDYNSIIYMADEITNEQKWLSELLYLLPQRTTKDLALKRIDIETNKAVIYGYAKDYVDIGWFVMELENIGKVSLDSIENMNTEEVAIGKGEIIIEEDPEEDEEIKELREKMLEEKILDKTFTLTVDINNSNNYEIDNQLEAIDDILDSISE